MPPQQRDAIWYVLDNIQDDINRLALKSDDQLITSTQVVENLKTLTKQVSDLKVDVKTVQDAVGVKTPKEVQVERWKVFGQIIAAAIAVMPGIFAFIHSFM